MFFHSSSRNFYTNYQIWTWSLIAKINKEISNYVRNIYILKKNLFEIRKIIRIKKAISNYILFQRWISCFTKIINYYFVFSFLLFAVISFFCVCLFSFALSFFFFFFSLSSNFSFYRLSINNESRDSANAADIDLLSLMKKLEKKKNKQLRNVNSKSSKPKKKEKSKVIQKIKQD